MKKDRFWLYWGIYAGILLAVNVLLVFFFPQNATFHIAMIFPAICLWRLIYEGWYVRIRFVSGIIIDAKNSDDLANELKDEPQSFLANPPFMFEKIYSSISLYISPWTLPFLLLVPGFAKVFSLLLVVLPFAIAYGFVIFYNHKYSKQQRNQAQKAREEQEQREELGKWR
jgi:hypothetical protein